MKHQQPPKSVDMGIAIIQEVRGKKPKELSIPEIRCLITLGMSTMVVYTTMLVVDRDHSKVNDEACKKASLVSTDILDALFLRRGQL